MGKKFQNFLYYIQPGQFNNSLIFFFFFQTLFKVSSQSVIMFDKFLFSFIYDYYYDPKIPSFHLVCFLAKNCLLMRLQYSALCSSNKSARRARQLRKYSSKSTLFNKT